METAFLLNQLIKVVLLFAVQYSTGLLVVLNGIKVNYTRKINHFVLFLVPVYQDRVFAYEDSAELFVSGTLVTLLSIAIYTKPIRTRVPVIGTMFRSFDRPEDRPYTLMWLFTQLIAGYLVIIPMGLLFAHYDLLHLMLIPVLINGIGDGLAEPVGVRFGRNHYHTYAIFTRRKYIRTLEGSACVLLTSIITIAAFYPHFTSIQFAAAMLIIPPLLTAAEAFSPHTWDTPFIFLAGYLALFTISLI